ncbi:MAG: histidine kinase dimerization/phospho-acceptor domain-containing protein [Ignavibacteriota bacterium]
MPVDLPGNPGAVLRAAIPLEQVAASLSAVRMLILRASGFAAVLALALAYWIAQSVSRRVCRIQAYATELVNEDYSGTLSAEGDDELGSVARSLRSMATHFRRMLDRIAQESARREAILTGMVEGVLAVDRNLRITFFNGSLRTRRPRADVGARGAFGAPGGARSGPAEDAVERDCHPGAGARADIPPAFRRTHLRSAGRAFPRAREARAPSLPFHDITEVERLERVRKDFVANISHELRTPLAAIQGYAETLLDGALEDQANNRKFLGIIAAHTVRLTNLATDLLTLSEIEPNGCRCRATGCRPSNWRTTRWRWWNRRPKSGTSTPIWGMRRTLTSSGSGPGWNARWRTSC